jgi:hypothetical protein
VISLIKLDFWTESCQDPLMVVEANHEGLCRKSSVFYNWPFNLLFYISSSGKSTFCDTVLLQSAISLVSSSNTWYLREIK